MATQEVAPDLGDPAVAAGGRDPRRAQGGGGRGALAFAAAVAVYTLIAVIGFWHVWSADPSVYASYAGGDQAASMWFLTWVPYAIMHGHNPLFTTLGNHPYGLNLLVNTSTLALGLLAMPVTLLFGAVVSFNLLCTLAFVASGAAAYALVRRFTSWRPAAFVGGLLYGFSPYMVSQGVGHLNLFFVPLPPLILLVLHELVVRQRGRAVPQGILLGALLVVQFFVATEILLGTVVIGVAGVVLAALFGHGQVRAKLPHAARGIAAGGVLAVALLAYPIWYAAAGRGHIVGAIQSAPQVYRADLLGSVLPDSLQHFAPASSVRISEHFAGNGSENGSYLGIPLLVVLLTGIIVCWRDLRVRVIGLLGAFAVLLSLGSRLEVGNHIIRQVILPEGVFDKLPFLENVIPSRYALYAVLCAAVVLGIVLERLRSLPRWPHPVLAVGAPALVAAVALLPLVPSWPYPMVPAGPPPYFTSGAADAIAPGTVTLVYPFPDANFANPQVWQAATFMRFSMPGGRFIVPGPGGRMQPSHPSSTDTVLALLAGGAAPAETPALRSRIRAELHSWGVQAAVAVPVGVNYPQARSFLTWLAGRPPTLVDGVDVWHHF